MRKANVNFLDRAVAFISPSKGLKRISDRLRVNNFYDAAKPRTDRRPRTDRGSGDAHTAMAGDQLRIMARDLDGNHDLASGVLDILVNRTVGRGIRYEPQVKDLDGELHDDFNELLLDRHTRWAERPDVTREMSYGETERLFARTYFRDGEAFKVYHQGKMQKLKHRTPTLLSLDVFEPDYCPLGYNNQSENIIQGVKKNGWGEPKTYFFHKHHPGSLRGVAAMGNDFKAVPAYFVNHVKHTKRLGQTRGVSIFHSVMLRLDDLKDYEEAERIAARIAAKMVAAISKGSPDDYGDARIDSEGKEQSGRETIMPHEQPDQIFENGMTFLDLAPGESVDVIDSKRPNVNLEPFRNGQLRAVAAGAGVSYSSASKDYNGTFSAQRQELVEQQINYEVLLDYFVTHSSKPDYQRFVDMTLLAGEPEFQRLMSQIDTRTLHDVECYGTAMPWIDPDKEAKAHGRLIDRNLMSESQAIRKRGDNPSMVYKQIARDQRLKKKYGIEEVESVKTDT